MSFSPDLSEPPLPSKHACRHTWGKTPLPGITFSQPLTSSLLLLNSTSRRPLQLWALAES